MYYGAMMGTVVLLVCSSGCRIPVPAPRPQPPAAKKLAADPPLARTEAAPTFRRSIGRSVEARPIEAIELGTGEDRILILASIHGDEAAGTPLVEALADLLVTTPELLAGHRVIIVPEVNPDGVAYRRRHNVNGVDLNRNFPAGNYRANRTGGEEPLSEPESLALRDLVLEVSPSRVVTIHQPLGCVDYDGPAQELAETMAEAGPLGVRKLGSRPGSLGSWVGLELGIPIVTLELPGSATGRTPEELWEKYGTMLIAAIDFGNAARAKGPVGPQPPSGSDRSE
ncbi:MAG: DUF2817 domain-containing protein [Planctomycetota bacterium]